MPLLPADHPQQSAAQQELAEARARLRAHLAQYPTDEQAWYRLSRLAETPAEGMECLVQALEARLALFETQPEASSTLASRLRALADQIAPGQEPAPAPPAIAPPAVAPPAEAPPAAIPQPAWPLDWAGWLRLGLRAAGYALTVAVLGVLLAVAGPLLLGSRPLIILSGSMGPVLPAGSVVVVQPVPAAKLQVGDIIAYRPPTGAVPIVHRIVRVRDEGGVRYYTTRGDANPADDPEEVPLPGTAWKVWYAVPLAGYAIEFASRPAGRLLLVIGPLAGLLLQYIYEWARQRRPWTLRPAISLAAARLFWR